MMKAVIRAILEHAEHYKWSLQGFGMLRTYLDEQRIFRLQVWDNRYRIPGVSLIHDHPWNFKSKIIAGELWNTRYVRRDVDWNDASVALDTDRKFYSEKVIIAGEGGGVRGNAHDVELLRQDTELYKEGEEYSQRWYEVHESNFSDGTVTIIERDFKEDKDAALVYYPMNEEWVSAEPRPATKEEVLAIVGNSLERWF